jgi:MFS family permease
MLSELNNNTAAAEQSNFHHFVLDIAWFGLALAATTRFLSVYAIRLGATPIDLGWISSLPALVLIVSAALGGWWMRRYGDPVKALFMPGLGYRLMFLLPALVPFVPPQWQPLALILAVAIPALPQGIAGVNFIVVMREAIVPQHLTRLVSRRMVAMNVTIGIGALAFGIWLEKAPFPFNYQIMFLLAFGAALVSQWHCTRIHVLPDHGTKEAIRQTARVNAWKSPRFRQVALVAAIIHIAFYSIVPITPLYLVERMNATEGFMALFGMMELAAGALVALLSPRIIQRIGTRAMIGLAMVGTALAAIIIATAPHLYLTLIAALLSGGAWTAAANVGLFSFFNESAPREDMASYSTAYHQIIGLSMFIGPMIGSHLANSGIDLVLVMMIGAALRLLAGPLIEHNLLGRLFRRAGRATLHAEGLNP